MTYHDLREREQHERRPERAARHAQHLHTTPMTDRDLISIPSRARRRKIKRTPATPRSTRRMLLRMMMPTSARLTCREIAATLSCGTCTNGSTESMCASTSDTTSAFVCCGGVPSSPGVDGGGGERGRTRLTIDCEKREWRLSCQQSGRDALEATGQVLTLNMR